jgi:hypothetical protein
MTTPTLESTTWARRNFSPYDSNVVNLSSYDSDDDSDSYSDEYSKEWQFQGERRDRDEEKRKNMAEAETSEGQRRETVCERMEESCKYCGMNLNCTPLNYYT